MPNNARQAYERHKAEARARRREISEQGRDIGDAMADAIKQVDKRRRKAAAKSLRVHCETYHGDAFKLAWSDDHLTVIAKLETAVRSGGCFAEAMPRGSGKTTLAWVAAEWALLNGWHHFVAMIGSDEDSAKGLLDSVKSSLEHNDTLAADYPEVCLPIRKLEGIHNRAKGQTCWGHRTNLTWTSSEIILPTVRRGPRAKTTFPACAGIIRVAGITGRIRGMQYTRPDGTVARPSMAIIDDPQTDESAKSESQCETREATIAGAILGLAGPGRKISAVMPCTVIKPGDMADRLLNRNLHPEWNGERMKMVYEWPDAVELWNQYTELYREQMVIDGTFTEATAFYKKHRKEMDAGSKVAWPERYNHDEISALQHAFNLRLRDRASFYAEYQNDPLPDESADDAPLMLTRAALAARADASIYAVSSSERHEDGDSMHRTDDPDVPLEVAVLACDVQRGGERAPGRIYYTLYAEDANRSLYPLAWGSIRCSAIGSQPTRAQLHDGLRRLMLMVREEKWPCPVVMRGVDVGDRSKDLLAWITANRGWYAVRGQDTRMSVNEKYGDIRGVIHPRKQDGGAWVFFIERDNVREEIHAALSMPVGSAGAFELPAGLDQRDALIRHLVGTTQIMDNRRGLRWSTSAKDRKHHPEWQRRIDYLDCTVYARALLTYWRTQQQRRSKQPRKYGVIRQGGL